MSNTKIAQNGDEGERPSRNRNGGGNVFESRAKWYARTSLGAGKRHCSALPLATNEEQARARAAVLASFALALRGAGFVALAPRILDDAGAADEERLESIRSTVTRLVAGELRAPASVSASKTFGDVADAWTSGELAARYPDHVKVKRSNSNDRGRLKNYVLPTLRDVPMTRFALDHAEEVMRKLPAGFAPTSRRQVAQVINRIVRMAVYPLRIIATSPLPAGWMPRAHSQRVRECLYPAEEAKLMGHELAPLSHRLLFGVMAREGLRPGEAAALRWSDLDLEHGGIQLDKNKTDDPRSWALSPDVTRALAAWQKIAGKRSEYVFSEPDGTQLVRWETVATRPDGSKELRPDLTLRAEVLRSYLAAAGVDRAALFEDSETREPTRTHDLRGSFVTVALANGRSETWVMDRTGHTTSEMVHAYRRRARKWAELGLGELAPLDVAIPELSDEAAMRASEAAQVARAAISTGSKPRRIESEGGRKPKASKGFRRVDSNHDSRIQRPMPDRPTGEISADSWSLVGASKPSNGPPDPALPPRPEGIEEALAGALVEATKAGRWEVVAQLARELEARRLGAAGVPSLVDVRKRGAR